MARGWYDLLLADCVHNVAVAPRSQPVCCALRVIKQLAGPRPPLSERGKVRKLFVVRDDVQPDACAAETTDIRWPEAHENFVHQRRRLVERGAGGPVALNGRPHPVGLSKRNDRFAEEGADAGVDWLAECRGDGLSNVHVPSLSSAIAHQNAGRIPASATR